MERIKGILSFLLLILGITCVHSKRGYLMTAPKVMHPGTTERVCFTFFELDEDVRLTIKLMIQPNAIMNLETLPKEGGCVELQLSATTSSKGDLEVSGETVSGGYSFKGEEEVTITSQGVLTFVQTDKPQYKPGQTVRFRVLSLDANLRPLTAPIHAVWIEDPSGVRMAQWLDVVVEKGLVSFEMSTSEEPVLGVWKVKVQLGEGGTVEEKPFKVEEYVLPKYEIVIKPPAYLPINAEKFEGEICAKYTYGKPVKGNLWLKMCITNTYGARRPRPCQEIFDQEINGCFKFDGNATLMELQNTHYSIYGAKLRIDAMVTEEATGVVLNATDESAKVERYLINFDFKTHTPVYYKPSLPFHGKLLATKPNGSPMSGELVTIEANDGRLFREEIRSNSQGEVIFTIPHAPADGSSFTITAVSEAHTYKYSSALYTPYAPRGYHQLKQWFSPSGSFLQIEKKEDSQQCGAETEFEVTYTTELNTTFIFHHELMSRGNIVSRGHKRHHFLRHDTIDGGEPEVAVKVNLLGETGRRNPAPPPSPADEVEPLEHIARMTVSIQVGHELSPRAHLLVYYVREDGEVVADSVAFDVQQCLENEVSLTFEPSEVGPGESTILGLKAAPQSMCSVGVVDKSVHVLGGNNQLNPAKIFSILSGYDLNEDNVNYGRDTYCEDYLAKQREIEQEEQRSSKGKGKRNRQPRSSMPWWPGGAYSDQYDSIKAFKLLGMNVLTDLTLETRPCQEDHAVYYDSMDGGEFYEDVQFSLGAGMPGAGGPVAESLPESSDKQMDTEKPAVDVRTYFPETWLWELYDMGDESELNLPQEVPHTITDWVGSAFCVNENVGLGVSETTTLRAFQPFFLSFNLPYSVVRGETMRVPITVFNYLEECIVIEISLESTVQLSVSDGTQNLCVCGNEAKSAYFAATAQELGMVNLTAKAVSVSNKDFLCENKIVKHLNSVRDAATRQILVEPEGQLQEYTISNFACATDGPVNERVDLELPVEGLVEGSARATVSVIGDVMGPALSNLDGLIRMPTGCGEQNMILFAPNIFVMQYLTATNQLTPELGGKALGFMKTGYQRELTYRHDDGSYSAFGNSDDSGSTWLTAFVVRSFAQAKEFIFIDDDDLHQSVEWFRTIQMENGCFRQVGKVLHKDMKGGLSGGSSPHGLTAFVLVALLDAKVPTSDEMIMNAITCLKSASTEDKYTLSLIMYAYSLLDSDYAPIKATMKERMDEMADTKDGMKHWSKPASEPVQPVVCWMNHAVSANVEMTAYALMGYLNMASSAIGEGLPIVRWLSSQRNANGGFSSTQDTVVALQALADYAALVYGDGVDVNVALSEGLPDVHITEENSLLLHQHDIRVPSQFQYTVSGTGCALVQAGVKYHRDPDAMQSDAPAFVLQVTVENARQEFPKDHCSHRKLNICAKYTASEPTNMAVVSVKMQTGWIPDKMSLKQMLKDGLVGLKRQEINFNKVDLYFDELRDQYTCMSFFVEEDMEVSDPKNAFVQVYDYYDTDQSLTVNYKIKRTCGTKEELPELTPDEYDDLIDSGFEGQIRQPIGDPFIEEVVDRSTCPVCYDESPEDLAEIICSAKHVYKTVVKKGKVRILSDLLPELRSPYEVTYVKKNDLGVSFEECPCNILSTPLNARKNLNTRLLFVTREVSLSSKKQGRKTVYQLPLGPQSMIMPLKSDRVVRDIIKKCDRE